MDKYAIIKIGSAQYKVHEGETIEVDHVTGALKADVLMFSDGKETVLGDPTVKGVSVKLKENGVKKGEKLVVSRFKSKSRYRKKRGYRDTLSVVLVEKIEVGSKKAEDVEKAAEEKKSEKPVMPEKKKTVNDAKKPAEVKKTVKKEAPKAKKVSKEAK